MLQTTTNILLELSSFLVTKIFQLAFILIFQMISIIKEVVIFSMQVLLSLIIIDYEVNLKVMRYLKDRLQQSTIEAQMVIHNLHFLGFEKEDLCSLIKNVFFILVLVLLIQIDAIILTMKRIFYSIIVKVYKNMDNYMPFKLPSIDREDLFDINLSVYPLIFRMVPIYD
ncbi:hypothetical protein CDAR_219541 [Caerostris darwini]|uniref:Uncharacterized protein n=1 Tax=Caerostris darwini TaxID=1538125 RepID=A0AAV4TF78_9ARAC|nr:hypothetical protein CDAR_219541 [Caerostris darwini]